MKKNKRILKIGVGLIIALFFIMLYDNLGKCKSLTPGDDDKKIIINFDTRVQFYLDLKTKRFLKKMVLKEKLLVQIIQAVSTEIQERGKNEYSNDDAGFNLIYKKSRNLLDEYESEIESIKNIVLEIEKLELTIQKIDDMKLLSEVEKIKDRLLLTLDDQKLVSKRMTKQQVAGMIKNYSKEIDQVMHIYEQIVEFQKKANAIGDEEVIKQLDREKQRIIRILEESRIAGASPDKVLENYIDEATSIVQILKKIDQMEIETELDSTNNLNINELRKNIISSVDNRILELFGYTQKTNFNEKLISKHFNEWKTERVASYQVKYTKYRIFRDNLIKTANSLERNRMLEREISSALLNYADQNFELAEMQFKLIFSAYNDYYPKLASVVFYQSESNFANNYYDTAREGYTKIINEYPDSKFVDQSYLRLMIISKTYGWSEKFFKNYNKVIEFSTIEKEDLNKSHYLAAEIYLDQRQYKKANEILEKINKNSKYYLSAQYLQGTIYSNLEKYTQARKIFEKIIDSKTYPWTDINNSVIRNESLLKLGYLNFQRGDYEKAILYFDQISKGADNYDSSLIGQAWANLKKGQYNNAINKVDLICNNYLLSNYSYEALVLSAHCKRIQNRNQEALENLKYVTDAQHVLNRVNEYNDERARILKQLDEVEVLEEKILESQNRQLYPQVVRIRDLINDALTAFRYRGAIGSRVLEEYNDERKILIRQIEEFDDIVKYAEEQNNDQMLENAIKQRDRLISVLEEYQLKSQISGISYFIDYPLATKEGGLIYRRGIIKKLISGLLDEKQRVQKDLDIVAELLTLSDQKVRMDATIELEIIEEDLKDLHNQLNQFQVWLSNNQVEEIKTDVEQWADFSGYGVSDINFTNYQERGRKIGSYSKNLNQIESVLKGKQKELENRVLRFENEMTKIQREMKAEKNRLEKLEKEKYFQEIYFETKMKEIERKPVETFDENSSIFN